MSKNKVITTQFKLIEMSQTRACGWIEKYILRKTKLPLIVHVSVSKKPNKWDNKRLSPFYYSSILTPSLTINTVELFAWFSVPFTWLSKLFFRGKKSSYQLFVWMWFVFRFLVSFLLFSSIRESKYNKVGILFINATYLLFPIWMWSHSYISLELRPERGPKNLWNAWLFYQY